MSATRTKDPNRATIPLSAGAPLSPPSDCPEAIDAGPPEGIASNNSGPPFSDFVGRCFFQACLWLDWLESRIRSDQGLLEHKIESPGKGRGRRLLRWFRSCLGAASCAVAAVGFIPLFSGTSHSSVVPFLFLVVILCVALRFGDIAGVIGTLSGALVFELFLFAPKLSFAIANSTERNHLISMVILGICASELLGRRKGNPVYKPW
jgi:Domain of unknown function (DUF4118)